MRHRPAGGFGPWPLLALLAGLTLAGCAEGRLSGDADAGEDAVEDPIPDRALDPDVAPDNTVDLRPDPVVDPTPDRDEPELVGECVPFSVTCSEDGYAIQRCSSEGALFDPFECAFDEICEDGADGVQCGPCEVDVNCREEEPACEPDTAFCLDYQTAAQCTADGQVGVTSGCGTGRCFGGGCNTTGNATGQVCTADTGCRGRHCICGEGDTDNLGTAVCAGDLAPGYCTTGDCHENGCNPDTEVCADFELSGAFGGGHYCLLREDCGTRLASCRVGHRGDGHVCRELPVSDADGARTWALGCWAPPPSDPLQACSGANCLAPIGGACNTDAGCVGGLCLRVNNISYCAAACDESRGCPAYAACVRPDAGSDNHFCLAKAQEADCPRLEADFNIVSASMPRLGGVSSAQVCWVRQN